MLNFGKYEHILRNRRCVHVVSERISARAVHLSHSLESAYTLVQGKAYLNRDLPRSKRSFSPLVPKHHSSSRRYGDA